MARLSPSKIPTRTPETPVKAFKPAPEEMHPSKAHQSTTKTVDSGLVLGFKPIPKSPAETLQANTPSKTCASTVPYESSNVADKILSRTPAQEHWHLSDEARRLMDSIRADAARIEADMREKMRVEQALTGSDKNATGTRRLAKPIKPSGRFSDVHKAHFEKMASIADHPSSHRSLLPPVVSASPAQRLKRKLSKTNLSEETQTSTKSTKRSHTSETSQFEQVAGLDAATPLPSTSQNGPAQSQGPVTPDRVTVARAATVHQSKIARPARTADGDRRSPRTPQTEFNPKYRTQIPGLRSILRKRQPLFSTDPAKIAAGTHVPPTAQSWRRQLYGLDCDSISPAPSPSKRVAFSPSTKGEATANQVQISADATQGSEIAVPLPDTPSGVVRYPSLPPVTPSPASITKSTNTPHSGSSTPVPSPKSPSVIASLRKRQSAAMPRPLPAVPAASQLPCPRVTPSKQPASIPHGLANKKRHRDQVDDEGNEENVPPTDSVAGDGKPGQQRAIKRLKSSRDPSITFAESSDGPQTKPDGVSRTIRTFIGDGTASRGTHAKSSCSIFASTASSAARAAAAERKLAPHTPTSRRPDARARPHTTTVTRHVTPAGRGRTSDKRGIRSTAVQHTAASSSVSASASASRRTTGSTGISISRLAALAQPKRR
ncbi:hypothetical protein KEM52_001235 [Ascosphaera acerosa]|nr:hypothetical protein KEM52_001235 [Ascosphaera acerosa]